MVSRSFLAPSVAATIAAALFALPAAAWHSQPDVIIHYATPTPTPPAPQPDPDVHGSHFRLHLRAYFNSASYQLEAQYIRNGADLIDAGQVHQVLYRSPACRPGSEPFAAVLSADPGRAIGELWQEVDIRFGGSFGCQQLTSAGLVTGWANQGLFKLDPTDRVFRLRVVGGR